MKYIKYTYIRNADTEWGELPELKLEILDANDDFVCVECDKPMIEHEHLKAADYHDVNINPEPYLVYLSCQPKIIK